MTGWGRSDNLQLFAASNSVRLGCQIEPRVCNYCYDADTYRDSHLKDCTYDRGLCGYSRVFHIVISYRIVSYHITSYLYICLSVQHNPRFQNHRIRKKSIERNCLILFKVLTFLAYAPCQDVVLLEPPVCSGSSQPQRNTKSLSFSWRLWSSASTIVYNRLNRSSQTRSKLSVDCYKHINMLHANIVYIDIYCLLRTCANGSVTAATKFFFEVGNTRPPPLRSKLIPGKLCCGWRAELSGTY